MMGNVVHMQTMRLFQGVYLALSVPISAHKYSTCTLYGVMFTSVYICSAIGHSLLYYVFICHNTYTEWYINM